MLDDARRILRAAGEVTGSLFAETQLARLAIVRGDVDAAIDDLTRVVDEAVSVGSAAVRPRGVDLPRRGVSPTWRSGASSRDDRRRRADARGRLFTPRRAPHARSGRRVRADGPSDRSVGAGGARDRDRAPSAPAVRGGASTPRCSSSFSRPEVRKRERARRSATLIASPSASLPCPSRSVDRRRTRCRPGTRHGRCRPLRRSASPVTMHEVW